MHTNCVCFLKDKKCQPSSWKKKKELKYPACVGMFLCMYAYMCVCGYVYVCMCVCMYNTYKLRLFPERQEMPAF